MSFPEISVQHVNLTCAIVAEVDALGTDRVTVRVDTRANLICVREGKMHGGR